MRKHFLCLFIFLLAFCIPASFTKATAAPSQAIVINTATNTLAFYQNGSLVREFPVATGKASTPTPQGKFKIVNKIKNRPYYKGNIKGGDPSNPLGDRWLGINANGTSGDTYAIHGNNNESSIGSFVSSGCIRMHNADVRWLFDQIQTGATVMIKKGGGSYEAIAASYGVSLGKASPVVSTPVSHSTGAKTTANLNVRSGPSISASRIATLPKGTSVTIVESKIGWYRVTAGSTTGWVSADYISGASSAQPTAAIRSGQTHVALNVRTGPSTSNARITTLKAGSSFSILEESNGWYRISTGGVTGWVSGDYVSSI